MTLFEDHAPILARVLTSADVTALGGMLNGVSFVAGDYYVRDSLGDYPVAGALFSGTYGPVGEADTKGFNQYLYTQFASVTSVGDGTYDVVTDGHTDVVSGATEAQDFTP